MSRLAVNALSLLAFTLLLGISCQSMAQQGRRNFVELEIVAQAGGPILQNQEWLEILSEVGADSVRVRQDPGSPRRPNIDKSETPSGTSYRITGLIVSGNRLALPGGTFSKRDTTRIREYITSIRADGAETALAEKVAFGLTAQQLVDLHTQLSTPCENSTLHRRPADVLDDVRARSPLTFVIDPSAAGTLNGDYQLEDQMQGLSHGTVLAAALRPLGLVLAPRREQGQALEIVITDVRRVEEHWPVGWPLEVRPSQAIPKLHDRIPVRIRNYTMAATLPAIQSALDVPFLFDRNSMARSGVDLEDIRINVESEQLSYQLILTRVVSQARPRMDMEIRADETGKPFVWFWAR